MIFVSNANLYASNQIISKHEYKLYKGNILFGKSDYILYKNNKDYTFEINLEKIIVSSLIYILRKKRYLYFSYYYCFIFIIV